MKYSTLDEYGRIVDENVSLDIATETVQLNPGCVRVVIAQINYFIQSKYSS